MRYLDACVINQVEVGCDGVNMIYLALVFFAISFICLVYVVAVLINPKFAIDKKTGEIPLRKTAVIDQGLLSVVSFILGFSVLGGLFTFIATVCFLIVVLVICSKIYGSHKRSSSGDVSHSRRISFDYVDRFGHHTHRTALVLSDGGDRLNCWCETAMDERTFIKWKMSNIVEL